MTSDTYVRDPTEEQWMKMVDPIATSTFRREHDIPSNDGLESYVMQDEERQKRDRLNTTLTVPKPVEKRRKRTANVKVET